MAKRACHRINNRHITMSHGRHGASNQLEIKSLFNSLFSTKKTPKLHINGPSRCETNGDPYKRSVMRKVFPCHDVFIRSPDEYSAVSTHTSKGGSHHAYQPVSGSKLPKCQWLYRNISSTYEAHVNCCGWHVYNSKFSFTLTIVIPSSLGMQGTAYNLIKQ